MMMMIMMNVDDNENVNTTNDDQFCSFGHLINIIINCITPTVTIYH